MNEPVGSVDPAAPAASNWSFYGVQLSARIVAAANDMRGGDWCEAFVVGDGVIALSIGDVCGHGKRKYGTMVAIRKAVRDAARRGLDPAQTLAEAHRFLRAYDPDDYATALLAHLHVESRTLVFANAGHPPLLICEAERTAFVQYPQNDLPLGIEEAFTPALRILDIPEGSQLVLYTDGVTEHLRKPLQGEAELLAAAAFAYRETSVPAADAIASHMKLGGFNHDDVAILTASTPRLFRRLAPKEGR